MRDIAMMDFDGTRAWGQGSLIARVSVMKHSNDGF
jgi:hypothetical protein